MEQKNNQEERAQKRLGGFTKIPNFIFDLGFWAKLSPNAKAVYAVISSHAHYETGVCHPVRETITQKAGIHIDGFYKARQELVEAGLIKTWRQKCNSSWHYKVVKTPEERLKVLDELWRKSITNIGKNKGDKVWRKSIDYPRNPKTGRYVGSEKSILGDSEKSITNPLRIKSITKENINIIKENSTEGSSLACLDSQASPSENPNQNLKSGLVSENLKTRAEDLLRDQGFSETIRLLVDEGAEQGEAEQAVRELMYGRA